MNLFEFSSSASAQLRSTPNCNSCQLFAKCRSPKLKVYGNGRRGILFVHSGPTRRDDALKGWTSGPAALEQWIGKTGKPIDIEKDCWHTGAVICSPQHDGRPSTDQVRHCNPQLLATIKELNPAVIVPIGQHATSAVLDYDRGKNGNRCEHVQGETIPSQKFNAWIVPLVDPTTFTAKHDVAVHEFTEQIGFVLAATSARPWTEVPDYQSLVDVITDEDKAAAAIERMHHDPRTEVVAVDYETNSLKPEGEGTAIWTVSWSNGYETMAAPWYPKVREASRELIRSKLPKIACNLKFEERWTIHEFGHGMRNWMWDTMQAAHWMHQRPGITSIKFQAYAKLGQGEYESFMKTYFKTSGSSMAINNIANCPIDELLRYNGMDTLLELLVALEQIEESGFTKHHPLKERFASLRPKRIVRR